MRFNLSPGLTIFGLNPPDPPKLARRKASQGGTYVSGCVPLVSSRWSLMSVLPGSPQCLYHELYTEVNLRIILEDSFSHLHPLPAAKPGRPVPPAVAGYILPTPFNG